MMMMLLLLFFFFFFFFFFLFFFFSTYGMYVCLCIWPRLQLRRLRGAVRRWGRRRRRQ